MVRESALQRVLGIDYSISLVPEAEKDGRKYWVARIPLLNGCMAVGDTPDGALTLLDAAKREWLADALEAGEEIPVPAKKRASGKFTLRLSKSLHEKLIEEAEEDGVSLNQYISTILAERQKLPSEVVVDFAQAVDVVKHFNTVGNWGPPPDLDRQFSRLMGWQGKEPLKP